MNDNEGPMVYSVDDETKEILTEFLNLIEGLADLQMTDEATEELRLLNRDVGARFGIEFTDIVLESDQDSDGNPRFTVKSYRTKEELADKRPSYLRLVSDNDKQGASDGASDDDKG
tara:strand:- start:509 stop:856 length:348 start_codon:yes stop_codon:yes gene_type:complete